MKKMSQWTKGLTGAGILALVLGAINHVLPGHNHALCDALYAFSALMLVLATLSWVKTR